MNESVPPPAYLTPSAPTEVTCLRCGYTLHAPERTSRCPECGRPAALSIDGVRLVALMPSYLRKTAAGLLIVFIGTLLYCISAVTMYGFRFVGATGPLGAPNVNIQIIALVVFIVAGLGFICILSGWMIATSKAPHVAKKIRSRGITQRGVVAIAASLVCFIAVSLLGVGGMGMPFVIGSTVAGLIMLAGFVLMYFGSLSYMRALADWIPDRLIERLVYVQIVVALAMILIAIVVVILGQFIPINDAQIEPYLILWMIVYAGMWILYLFTTYRLWSQFRRAIRDGAVLEAEAERLATTVSVSGGSSGVAPPPIRDDPA
ncbi:MAG: hypothetical protein KC983_03615 [Phycisphaerales bacterium]|nr:hypothetical protein [Phycisphaerales bacterium]